MDEKGDFRIFAEDGVRVGESLPYVRKGRIYVAPSIQFRPNGAAWALVSEVSEITTHRVVLYAVPMIAFRICTRDIFGMYLRKSEAWPGGFELNANIDHENWEYIMDEYDEIIGPKIKKWMVDVWSNYNSSEYKRELF